MTHRYIRAGICLMAATLTLLAAASGRAAGPNEAPVATMTGEFFNSLFQPCLVIFVDGMAQCATPPQPLRVQGQCDATGTSTLTLRTSGVAFGPYPGTFEETLTATIGPQTQAPVAPFEPFPSIFPGLTAETIGFKAGPLTRFDAEFTVRDAVTGELIVDGKKTIVANVANTGVCQTFDNEDPNNPVFPIPITGSFYIANAQALRYQATIHTEVGSFRDEGTSQAFMMNTFATCCEPQNLASAAGHLVEGFQSGLANALPIQPGRGCGDKNHPHAQESDCKKAPK